MSKYIVDNVRDFHLDHIFDCGQCFRWEKQADGSYTGIAFGKVVNMQFLCDEPAGYAADSGAQPSGHPEALSAVQPSGHPEALTAVQPSGRPEALSAVQPSGHPEALSAVQPAGHPEALSAVQPSGHPEALSAVQPSGHPEALSAVQPSGHPEALSAVQPSGHPEALSAVQPSGRLVIDNCTEAEFQQIWKPYLDLDRDYGDIKDALTARDQVMRRAVAAGQGIRILKQDLWETIVSFIISQNNNIPRIKGCIENLSELFGAPAGEYAGRAYHSVPGPQVVASLTASELAPVRLGYRAKYLIETARMVCERGLPENEEQLSALCGVGPKVANCILLFAMGRYDSFPVDVWMARVMNQLYGIDEGDKKGMCAYAREHFGDLGGFAQQYLFYYIRGINK